MKVYLILNEEYEGVNIFGIYSTSKEAKKELNHWKKDIDKFLYEDLFIEEWEVLDKYDPNNEFCHFGKEI